MCTEKLRLLSNVKPRLLYVFLNFMGKLLMNIAVVWNSQCLPQKRKKYI